MREYYKQHFPVLPAARSNVHFNPGNSLVSNIAHEPRAALAVLRDMIAPYVHNGYLTLLEKVIPVDADTDGDQINTVTVRNIDTGESLVLSGDYFLDATEEGDLLPLAKVEYVTGSNLFRRQENRMRCKDLLILRICKRLLGVSLLII